MSTEPTVPPRPDHLHPVPAAPPPPGEEEAPRREGATWSWVEAVGVYVVAFLIAGMLSLPVLNAFDEESDLANMTATVVAALVIVGILIGWLSIYHRGWVRVMRLPDRRRWGAEILAGVLFGLGLYVVAVVFVGGILLFLLNALSGDAVQAPEQVPQGLSAVGILVTSLYAIVIAPFGEELFFRGVLFRSLRDRHGLRIGLLGTAVGMILVFRTASQVGSGQAKLLAEGIYLKLETTVAGLLVAIPSVLFAALFNSRSEKLMRRIDEHLMETIPCFVRMELVNTDRPLARSGF